jgi:hypothetical protein
MTIMEVEWKSAPEVVVMRPGVEEPCPLDLLRGARRQCSSASTLDMSIHYVRSAFDDIDQYFYVRGRRWPLEALIAAYATEIDFHDRWMHLHTLYKVPDDFADVLRRVMSLYNHAKGLAATRRKLREAMRLPWEGFKDRLLAMEAAEAL